MDVRWQGDRMGDPVRARVRWAPTKSIWIGAMTTASMLLAPLYFSRSAVALCMGASAVTLCLGHSIGMHRLLIHRSFACPKPIEYVLVYLGVLVGMAGPVGMARTHDLRDWAQRQSACHDYFCHRRGFFWDAWWQLHCEIALERPPALDLADIQDDRVYAVLERTWMLQQLPWALAFLAIGGPSWLIWGSCVRVAVCVTGHWLVGHFAHRAGTQHWIVEGAAAQGYNVALAGLISMGEGWHNNHHAFPGSAKLGLYPGEIDLGWWVIGFLRRLGLAWDVVTPERLPARSELRPAHPPIQSEQLPNVRLGGAPR